MPRDDLPRLKRSRTNSIGVRPDDPLPLVITSRGLARLARQIHPTASPLIAAASERGIDNESGLTPSLKLVLALGQLRTIL